MVKEILKSLTYIFGSKAISDLEDYVNSYDVISFDLFDTLVKRDVVEEKQVFEIVEQLYEQEYGGKIKNYLEQRMHAEAKARMVCSYGEITLDEVYEWVDVKEEIKAQLKQLECDVEFSVCTPNIQVVNILKNCISNGKRVIVISDMYLPEKDIRKILGKCGLEEIELFLSSEYRKMKRNGELFRCVDIESEMRWLHIGDNIRSDFLVPKSLGIKTCLIRKNVVHNRYYCHKGLKYDDYSGLIKFISNRIDKYEDPFEIIGYEVLGPLLYAFVNWLSKHILPNEKVFFLAREGKIMRDAYEKITGRRETYLYVSRQAVGIPLLAEINNYDGLKKQKINNIHRYPTAYEFASSCGLTPKTTIHILNELGINEAEIISETKKKAIVEYGIKYIKKNAKEQKLLLSKYMEQQGMATKNILVDIGWFGTIQLELEEFVRYTYRKNIEFKGMYLGVKHNEQYEHYEKLKRMGFLYDLNDNKNIREKLAYTLPFFEILFLNTEATTCGYYEQDGCVKPLLGKKENIGDEERSIIRMQNAALDFVTDMHSSIMKNILLFKPEYIFLNYEKLAINPSRHVLELFKKFKVYDGGEYFFVSSKSLFYYMFHMREFKIDFLNNRCKLWFVKSIFKIPFPYLTILRFLKKFD